VSSVAEIQSTYNDSSKGFWTSAPVPIAIAIVRSRARRPALSSPPAETASLRPLGSRPAANPRADKLIDIGQHDQAIEHGDARKRDESDCGGD